MRRIFGAMDGHLLLRTAQVQCSLNENLMDGFDLSHISPGGTVSDYLNLLSDRQAVTLCARRIARTYYPAVYSEICAAVEEIKEFVRRAHIDMIKRIQA